MMVTAPLTAEAAATSSRFTPTVAPLPLRGAAPERKAIDTMTRALNGQSVARSSAAMFAATLLLASCSGTPSADPGTASPQPPKATSTRIPSADATTSATPSPTATTTEAERTPATAGPALFGHWASSSLAELTGTAVEQLDFPMTKATIEKAVAESNPDGLFENVNCASDLDLPLGSQGVACSFTDADGAERTAYAYGTYSSEQGVGLLLTFDTALSPEVAAKLSEPGAEVHAYGSGSMWGVEGPVAPEDVAALVLSMLAANKIPVTGATCDDPVDIPAKTNQITCTLQAEWGPTRATVIGGHVTSVGDNGILTIFNSPVE